MLINLFPGQPLYRIDQRLKGLVHVRSFIGNSVLMLMTDPKLSMRGVAGSDTIRWWWVEDGKMLDFRVPCRMRPVPLRIRPDPNAGAVLGWSGSTC